MGECILPSNVHDNGYSEKESDNHMSFENYEESGYGLDLESWIC